MQRSCTNTHSGFVFLNILLTGGDSPEKYPFDVLRVRRGRRYVATAREQVKKTEDRSNAVWRRGLWVTQQGTAPKKPLPKPHRGTRFYHVTPLGGFQTFSQSSMQVLETLDFLLFLLQVSNVQTLFTVLHLFMYSH